MKMEEIALTALCLPARERALLAALLRESVGDPGVLMVDQIVEDALALALGRDAELEAGVVEPLSHGGFDGPPEVWARICSMT